VVGGATAALGIGFWTATAPFLSSCQKFIRENLKDRDSYKLEHVVKHQGYVLNDGSGLNHEVSIDYSATNSFNARVRAHFVCEWDRPAGTNTWIPRFTSAKPPMALHRRSKS
jgi:hypothetical protein